MDGPACRYCALPLGSGDTCTSCRIDRPPLDRLIAAYQFDGAVRHAVHALKYRDLRALGPVLGRTMAALPQVARLEIDTVVPVPLHWRRLRTRGYNQPCRAAGR